jgi:Glycosyl transferases group 1
LAPYCADPQTFFPLPREDAALHALRRQLGMPDDAYVIGSFHSDTAFTIGPDRPKWQKGPDVFAEIVRRVREVEPRVCVLLAGPRRHWLRQRLKSLDVPVYFAGREVAGDDFASNILDRTILNKLYNLLDLYLVCSRWEGGPHSILEACFSQTNVLSTRVGIAEDILENVCLFDTIPDAVDRILENMRNGVWQAVCRSQHERALARNSPPKLAEALRRIYSSFPQLPKKGALEATTAWLGSLTRRLVRRRRSPPKRVGMISKGVQGELFEFLRRTLRQSAVFEVHEDVVPECQHYLIDESSLRFIDPKTLLNKGVALVCDNLTVDSAPPVDAIIVPSFEALSGRPWGRTKPFPLVIPPFAEGTNFASNVPIPQQLTSTVPGVAQTIRQLFMVLDSPEDVRWLGFR